MARDTVQPGIYNIEYFSGSQVAVYIGDIWIDEITSMQWSVQHSKRPLYGYASTLFDQVAKGQVLVQGSFTINFKEAGYLWLALTHYSKLNGHPFKDLEGHNSGEDVSRVNVERFVDKEDDTYADRNQLLSNLAAQAALTGFASNQRFLGSTFTKEYLAERDPSLGPVLGRAENAFEAFEDVVWGKSAAVQEELTRRADEPKLNGFDIYIAYGDFAGNDRNNHTMQKLTNVHIIGSGKSIETNGMPLQEEYQFIARNQI